MVELHFKDILNKESIDTIRESHGFRDSLPLEQFIMDFEVLTHIQEVIPDCVVKGGMAVPFHLHDKTLRRLSVDIDIVTGNSREEVIEAMKKVSEKLKGIVDIGDPHVPKKVSNKELPLLTYFCGYKSVINEEADLKIEIFYGNTMNIQSKKIKNGIEIIGLPINFPLSVYDHGSLIGDKLTTLPFNTIGIDPEGGLDVPKQIYDIAALIKSSSEKLLIPEIIDAFEKISNDEISFFKNDPPSFDVILADLGIFSSGLLEIDTHIKLNKSYEGRLGKFTTEMLGKARYPTYIHIIDILLINVFVKLVLKKFAKKIELDDLSKKITIILIELKRIFGLEMKEKKGIMSELKIKYGKDSDEEKLIKNLLPEQAYLYDQLVQIEKI